MLSNSAGHDLKFSHTAVSFQRFCRDWSSRVVSGGQRRFNWFSFSLRLLLGPQRLSMGAANWPSPVATWRSRQTWPGRHFCRSTGTTADKRFTPTTRLRGSASLGTTVWCLPPSPSGHQIYWDQGDSTWFLKDDTSVYSDWCVCSCTPILKRTSLSIRLWEGFLETDDTL